MRGSAPGERRGGRQRGTPNRRTLALAQAQAETTVKIAAALGSDAFNGDALAFLQAIYKDRTQAVELRLNAARHAVAYERPRLAAIALDGGPINYRNLEKLTDDELRALEAIQLKLTAPPLARVEMDAAEFEAIARRVASEI
jgi:hypothetical protein